MNPQIVLDLGREAMLMVLMTSGPILAASLLVGLLVSIFQAVTQVHEMTLTFVPKILAVFLTLVIFAPWMLRLMVGFTGTVFSNLPLYAR
jgi:flagellar biosynthetic protein FliQ